MSRDALIGNGGFGTAIPTNIWLYDIDEHTQNWRAEMRFYNRVGPQLYYEIKRVERFPTPGDYFQVALSLIETYEEPYRIRYDLWYYDDRWREGQGPDRPGSFFTEYQLQGGLGIWHDPDGDFIQELFHFGAREDLPNWTCGEPWTGGLPPRWPIPPV